MKKIIVNPEFLSLSKKNRKEKKKKKPTTLKSNKIKKAFLEKIKAHQDRKKYEKGEFKNKLEFENRFEKALDYLKKVQSEDKVKRENVEKRDSVGKPHIAPDPPWGVLKTGKKPLYRQYKNTLKKREKARSTKEASVPNRRNRLNEIKEKIKKNPSKTYKRYIKRRLGKQPNRKVYVMIDNKTERRKRNVKHRTLKNKKMSSIKSHLKKRGLLKTGSKAPQNIIRTIYEASSIAGDIVNIGEGVLLHNYLNKDDLKPLNNIPI